MLVACSVIRVDVSAFLFLAAIRLYCHSYFVLLLVNKSFIHLFSYIPCTLLKTKEDVISTLCSIYDMYVTLYILVCIAIVCHVSCRYLISL